MEPLSRAATAPRYKVGEDGMLDAASAVFAAEGFAGAKMAVIADRAGTTKPTLYARFGSKEDLYAAAIAREYELLKARLFAAYAEDERVSFRTQLERWNGAYFAFARDRPHGFKLIAEGERHPAAAAISKRAHDDIVDRIAVLIADVSGRRTGEGARVVGAMISGVVSRCAQESLARGLGLDDAAALCDSFLYPTLRALDLDLIEAVGRATPRRR